MKKSLLVCALAPFAAASLAGEVEPAKLLHERQLMQDEEYSGPTCFTPAGETGIELCFNGTSSVDGNWYITTLEDADAMNAGIAATHADMDTMWVMIAGILVFFMQAGFSMLEAGCVSSKNVQNILYKNLMDACIGALVFWLFGYAFAYGNSDDGSFIGTANFALSEETNEGGTYHSWFFQWAFAATAATIVSGAVAERTKLTAYFFYSIFLTMFVYPVVVHWVWDSEGWLCAWNPDTALGNNGMIDFAGSGVVHMVGGFSGLMGAIAVGPRMGRFEPGGDEKYKPHNVLIAALGVAILWFGWYGFNAGSTLIIAGGASAVASKVAVTTTLAAAGAATTCTIFSRIVLGHFDLMLSLNGVLAGLVSITAPCPVVNPLAAIAIGAIGAFVYMGSSKLLKVLKIDDPLDAFPIHGVCGFWGVLSVGLFATDTNVLWSYGNDNSDVADFTQLTTQLVGGLCIAGWTIVTSGSLFFALKFLGQIRVSAEEEEAGLDSSEHNGSAFNKSTELMPTGARSDA
jgi:Amt family ammonium transporter